MLGQATLERHLAALKAGTHTAAGTGILALVALARRAAQTGTGTAAHATTRLALFREGKEIVQLHDLYSSGDAVSQPRPPSAKLWQ